MCYILSHTAFSSAFFLFGLNFYFICTIDTSKGNKELISGMHYKKGFRKKSVDLLKSVSNLSIYKRFL